MHCRRRLIANALTQATRVQCRCRSRWFMQTHLREAKLDLRARVNAFSAH
jgi:hypothetical protein